MKNILKILSVGALVATPSIYANENLGQIVVNSATKSNQNISSVTSNIEVITSAQIEEKAAITVTQVLNIVSGVNFVDNGGVGQPSSLMLRGFSSKNILLLIDGIRYNDISNLNGASFENLLIDDIAQIEILKGAQSGIWGADASGGVINIITKKPQNGLKSTIFAEYGSFNTKKYGLSSAYRSSKGFAKVYIQKYSSDGFTAQIPNKSDKLDNYEDDGYENLSITLNGRININRDSSIDFIHKRVDSEVEFDGGEWGSSLEDIANNPLYYSEFESQLNRVNFNYDKDGVDSNIYISKSQFNRDYPNFSAYYDSSTIEGGLNSKIDYKTDITKKSFVVAGADYKIFEHKNSINKDYKNSAIFLTNSSELIDLNTILTQSIRYDKYSAFDSKLTGKIGIKHNLSKNIFLTANYGTAHNIPSLFHLYTIWGGNDKLNPESTKSYDISLGSDTIKATYFNNRVEDLIDYVVTDYETFSGKYTNIEGESKIDGFEIEYEDEVIEDLLISINYTNLNAKDKDSKILARRAKESIKFNFDYYGVSKLHIGVNGEYIGDRWDAVDRSGAKTGNYTIFNMVANYDIDNSLKTYLKVDNITDKKYQTVANYPTSPRAFYIGVNKSF